MKGKTMNEFDSNRLPNSMETWRHKRKKTNYTILRLCRIRNYEGGREKWNIGVTYTEAEKSVDWYVRECCKDFMNAFERVK